MPRFGEITDRGPIWEIMVGDPNGDPSVLVVGYSESNAVFHSTPPDEQVQDFAQALADTWGVSVLSVTRADTTQTVL